ncbi:MAG: prepilin-type N-terminal cleavage/methylation domain-containing protein [Armatimonadota bacterium]|nr:prepilin-type N-terminal cleavage/methylation domain-containing protein [Armatimonadota bacterium]
MARTYPVRRSKAPARSRAFTLVELLVVILIVAALVIIALPRYFHAVYRSRVRGCQAQIQIVNTSVEAFFARNKTWPTTVEDMCESTAPSWVVAPPLTEVPECPFGVPYELVTILQDGTVHASPTQDNPQVGVELNTWDHFDGSWKMAVNHKE